MSEHTGLDPLLNAHQLTLVCEACGAVPGHEPAAHGVFHGEEKGVKVSEATRIHKVLVEKDTSGFLRVNPDDLQGGCHDCGAAPRQLCRPTQEERDRARMVTEAREELMRDAAKAAAGEETEDPSPAGSWLRELLLADPDLLERPEAEVRVIADAKPRGGPGAGVEADGSLLAILDEGYCSLTIATKGWLGHVEGEGSQVVIFNPRTARFVAKALLRFARRNERDEEQGE